MRFLWLVLLLLFCTAASADDFTLAEKLEYDTDFRINLDYNYATITPIFENNLLDQVTFNSWIPGSLKLKYIGIHAVILDQAERYTKRIINSNTRRLYHNTNMTEKEANNVFLYTSSNNNPFGNWWDRKWFQSLPSDKGGAPDTIETIYIGHHIQIPDNWGVVTWIKDRFESVGDIWIRNDHLYDDENNSLIIPGETKEKTKKETDIDNFNNIEYQGTAIIINGKEFDHEWFKGDFYHFRFKPSLRVKGGPEFIDAVDEVSLMFVIELFKSKAHTHFADINFLIKYNIPDEEIYATVNFKLLTW